MTTEEKIVFVQKELKRRFAPTRAGKALAYRLASLSEAVLVKYELQCGAEYSAFFEFIHNNKDIVRYLCDGHKDYPLEFLGDIRDSYKKEPIVGWVHYLARLGEDSE